MIAMSNPRMTPVYFRMPPGVKLALARTVAELRAGGGVDGTVSQESVVGAAILWLEEMGPDAATAALARHVARWDAMRRGVAGKIEAAPRVEPGANVAARELTPEELGRPQSPRRRREGGA
jgi:hypothetical protein